MLDITKSPPLLGALSDLNNALGHTTVLFFHLLPDGDEREALVTEASQNIARALAILERL